MFKRKKILLFLLILIFVVKAFAQEKNNTPKKIELPRSLYTTQLSFLNVKSNINTKLDLTSFKFVIIDYDDVVNGYFNFSLENLKRTPTTFIYDDYKYVYLDRYFFKGYDLKKSPWLTN